MWLTARLGEATGSDNFVDISAGRIIGGEIVFERFRFVADGAACGAFGRFRNW